MENIGLSSKEALKRLKENGKNILKEGKKISPFKVFVCQFKDFLTIILLISTVITVFMGDYIEAITIGVIVFLNGIMGFIEEIKTEKTLEALKKMASPTAKVYRDGILKNILSEDLTLGDVILIETGDKVTADAVILKAERLSLDESVLTGESASVEKEECDIHDNDNSLHKLNVVYMGTTVLSGHALARVIAVGMQTQMGKIAEMIDEIKEEETPLQKRLNELGKIIAIGCLIICIIVSLTGFLRGEKIIDMLLTGVSLAVAAVPEGLPAIVTISLALAVGRMVKQKSLIRKLHAVETLGCADVICSDKTGTLTENKMTVQKLFLSGEEINLTEKGEFYVKEKRVNIKNIKEGRKFLEVCVLCNNAIIKTEERKGFFGEEKNLMMGAPTEIALLMMAKKAGVDKKCLSDEYEKIQENPFDSRRKMMSVLIKDRQENNFIMVKGAYDVLIEKCTGILENNNFSLFNDSDKKRIEEKASEFARSGLRVLAMAYKDYNDTSFSEKSEQGLVFLGLVAMMDPPRKEAKKAVKICKKAGIKTVMITGDHKETACAIAKEIGIFHDGDKVMSGKELDNISDEELKKQIENITVFARVSPHHKLKIVRVFKRRGHIVAMTGDGVNDAPAIKEADIGVSMGISGTDVTKEASDVILLDDNFATLVTAVEEGRTIYANIRKFIRYLLSCNIGEVLTMFLGMLMGMPIVLLPIHILLVNLVTDGLPALALGLEPADKNYMKKVPRRADEGIFSGGLLSMIIFRGSLIGLTTLGVFSQFLNDYKSLYIARTAAFLTLVLTQLIHVFECKSEEKSIFTIPIFNNMRLVAAVLFSALIVFLTIYLPIGNVMFKTVPLNKIQLIKVGGYLVFAPILSAVMEFIFNKKGKKKDCF